jgi:predicted metal-dependent peptidase
MEGRGGTDFREPLKEGENLPISSFIYLTDLYGTFPDKEPPFPVIWVAISDCPVPWGQVIRLPRSD